MTSRMNSKESTVIAPSTSTKFWIMKMNKYCTLAFLAAGVLTFNAKAQSLIFHKTNSLSAVLTNRLFEASSVAVGTNDTYYITDAGNNRIVHYNQATGVLTNLAGA